jgi:hypothetical protein
MMNEELLANNYYFTTLRFDMYDYLHLVYEFIAGLFHLLCGNLTQMIMKRSMKFNEVLISNQARNSN